MGHARCWTVLENDKWEILFQVGREQIKWKSWGDSNDSFILFSSLGGLGVLPGTLEAKRRLFLRSHEQPSFQSDISAKTAASR